MTPASTLRRLYCLLPAAVVLFIGVCYVIISSAISPQGDDLGIAQDFAWATGRDFYQFPRQCARFWMSVNGRLQNVLYPLLYHFAPRAALWVCNGAFTALLFWMTLRCSGLRSAAARMLMIALVAFTLPWWDVFLLFDVAIGYCWGTAIALAFLYLLYNVGTLPRGLWAQAGLMLLSLIAGGMHEALFVSLACGIGAHTLIHRSWRSLGPVRLRMLCAFALGGLYAISSPGIWGRLGGGWIVDGEWWELLLISSFYVLALGAIIIYMAIFSRRRLRVLCGGEWTVYAVSALVSLPVVAVGGIVGRPGMFGQVFALVAIALWARQALPRPSAWAQVAAASVLAVAVVAHYCEFARYQLRVGSELRQALALYGQSPDGTVYMDYTSDLDMPWWLLRKTRGVPDEDDFYINYMYTCILGDTARVWRVLPAELAGAPADSLLEGRPAGRGRVTLRPGGEEAYLGFGSRIITQPGRPDSVAVPITGTQAYYLTPRDYDPCGSW